MINSCVKDVEDFAIATSKFVMLAMPKSANLTKAIEIGGIRAISLT